VFYLYAVQFPFNQSPIAKRVPDVRFNSLDLIASYLQVPASILQKHLNQSDVAFKGYLVSDQFKDSLVLTDIPFDGERLWIYDQAGQLYVPEGPFTLEEVSMHGYSIREAAQVLKTCVPAVRRGVRKDLASGVNLEAPPNVIEVRVTNWSFRLRHCDTMPERIS
jgi:hypothetical protein